MTAAEQAVQAGDYELADVRLGDAAGAYEAAAAAAGAIREARGKLAGKDFASAAAAVLAAGQTDLGSEIARKLAGEIRVAAAMEACSPARAKAQAAVKDLAALSDGQGFGARKSEVQQSLAAGEEAWGRGAYEEAAWRYEDATAGAERVKTALLPSMAPPGT